MFRSAQDLRGYAIVTNDGKKGECKDFIFDEIDWKIRYMVMDTGAWISGRKVLISPQSLGQPDWASQTFPVNLSKDQIENSPQLDFDKAISRHDESRLFDYYKWSPYWIAGSVGALPPGAGVVEAQAARVILETQQKDFHLRSVRDVTDYKVQATDTEIGHIVDFILDDETWKLRYLIVDTRNWLPGKKVLVSPEWATDVKWMEQRVYVDLTSEQIKNSPPFEASAPVNRQYEERLYDYYGRPLYWNP